jgi:hypothetical protein
MALLPREIVARWMLNISKTNRNIEGLPPVYACEEYTGDDVPIKENGP